MGWLGEFLFPRRCELCGRLGVWLCGECAANLREKRESCPECGKGSSQGWVHLSCRETPGVERLIGLFDYSDKRVARLIKAVKYRFNQELVEEWLKGRDLRLEGIEVEAVVPIPLHWRRFNYRGFNQARVLAEIIFKTSGFTIVDGLERKRFTKPLAEMTSEKERRQEVGGVFVATKEARKLIGKRALVVDDVFTSGATMKEAARVLKKVGVAQIFGWVVAG